MLPLVDGNNFGIIPPNCMVGLALAHSDKTEFSFFFYKERLLFGAPLNAYQTDTL